MVTVVVNGVRRELQAPAGTPLLYVLRNDLELSGPQFGCGPRSAGPVRFCSTARRSAPASRRCRLPPARK